MGKAVWVYNAETGLGLGESIDLATTDIGECDFSSMSITWLAGVAPTTILGDRNV